MDFSAHFFEQSDKIGDSPPGRKNPTFLDPLRSTPTLRLRLLNDGELFNGDDELSRAQWCHRCTAAPDGLQRVYDDDESKLRVQS